MKNLRPWLPILIIGLVGVVAAFWAGTGHHQLTITLVFIWATMGLSWNIIGGYGGQVSFGHAAFFGIGAYTSTLVFVTWGVTPLIGMWVGIAAAVLAALLIGWPTFRLAGIYFALATLAYPLIFIPTVEYLGYQELALPFIRENAAWYLQFADRRAGSLVALVLLLAAVGITVLVERSRLGASLMAVRDNQPAAEAAGINTFRTKMTGYSISAAIAAAAGVIYASAVLFVVASQSVFGLLVSVFALIIPFIGGTGTVWGPVIGAALLIPISEWLIDRYGAVFPGLNGVVLGVALILVILFAPSGLYWKARDLVMARLERPVDREPALVREPAPASQAAASPGEREPSAAVDASHAEEFLPELSEQEIEAERRAAAARRNEPAILGVEGLTKSFGGLVAVNNVTFSVPRGEILGIIGPNGAGKTTLFDVVNGFLKPDSGRVVVKGKDVTGQLPHRICRLGVGRTFQIVRTFQRMTLARNVEIAAFHRTHSFDEAREVAAASLERVGLGGREHVRIPALDTNEVRLMELARALAGDPQVLLVDECLAGLSGEHVRELVHTLRSLRDEGLTIVVIEHTMSAMVGLVDRFIVLDHGAAIAEGPPYEVVRNDAVIEAYLGRRWAKHAGG
jgi:branched-chain amino acid transport system permease protein